MPKDFICPECKKPRKNARINAEVCSAGCRIKKLRRLKKEKKAHEEKIRELKTNKKVDK